MSLPQLNPLTAKLLGGADFRAQLRKQLLQKAEQTDDEAYARRLREAADGKRPLRTLLSDPSFLNEVQIDTPEAVDAMEDQLADHGPPKGTPEEVREQWRADLQAQGFSIADLDEAAGIFPEVMKLQQDSNRVVAEDREQGWDGSIDHLQQNRAPQDKAPTED